MINNKKQVYRVIIKLLSFVGLSVLSYFILRSAISPPISQTLHKVIPIRVDVSKLPAGQLKILRWNHKNIAILHRTAAMQANIPNTVKTPRYFVFINAGGDLNCPLRLSQKSVHYLQDSCSGYLYDSNGKALKPNACIKDLISPPHRFIDQNHLLIGTN